MVDFTRDTDDAMRERVLVQLTDILARHGGVLSPQVEIKEFAVVRTNDRKGYRSERAYTNASPYQGSPKTLIRIEVEAPDDVTEEFRELVGLVIAAETTHLSEEQQARLLTAQLELAEAQRRVDEAQAAVNPARADETK